MRNSCGQEDADWESWCFWEARQPAIWDICQGFRRRQYWAAGVLLLGSGALGLWISEKKKKKQDETAEWRKRSTQKNSPGKKETPCDLWNDDEDRRQAAVPYGYEEMRRINTAPDSRGNFYTGNELPEEGDYGETMILSVLWKGKRSCQSRE